MRALKTDVLILGSGGAGLLAALAASEARPRPQITVAVKGLFGKSGCTRMVQGGYNAALAESDSVEKHFLDTLKGGAWINDQELAWTLVSRAPGCVERLETVCGCFFDRNEDGAIHQKAFAGQSFDRTVHKGDLTGIEITNRVAEQLARREVETLEETRAVALLPARKEPERVAGALLLDVRSGAFIAVNAKCVLLATGGGPTLYKISACAQELATDGMAMAWEAGASFRDMEMVQFHPTGILTGDGLQITGTLLEEGLRGAGGHLKNADGERYMARYDPGRMERATRDVVARAGYTEIIEGRGTERGGVFIDVSHLGRAFVRGNFKGMVDRCADLGYDLAGGPVEVTPTAHYMMGGVEIDSSCRANLAGLYAAGEDAGGAHGANRLGGNGVANATVFGEIAGEAMAEEAAESPLMPLDPEKIAEAEAKALDALGEGESPYPVRAALKETMWRKAGLRRSGRDLESGLGEILALKERAASVRAGGARAYNLAWQNAIDVRNQLCAAELIARSALERDESRGSHYRDDHPGPGSGSLYNVFIRREGGGAAIERRPVSFTRLEPEAAPAAQGAPEPNFID